MTNQPLPGQRLVRVLVVLVIQLVIFGLGWVSLGQAQKPAPGGKPADAGVQLKIEPALYKQLTAGEGGLAHILVEMNAVADLSAALMEKSVPQRRQAVVAALQATAGQSQGRALAVLTAQAGRGKAGDVRSLWIVNGLAADADLDTVLQLAALPEVRLVRRDGTVHIADRPEPLPGAAANPQDPGPNISQIHADLVWNALNINGAGVVVANIDTGVDWLHPALLTRYRGYSPRGLYQHACNWFDATGGGALYPVDANGHGTHTMGTIVGEGGIGVAPGARWIAVRAFDSTGTALESWVHAATQWVLAPRAGCSAPDVVSNSWSNNYGGLDVYRRDLQALRAAGIFAPFAAGNFGPDSGSVGAPASYPEAFSVGAVTADDVIVSFSSRGPSVWFGSWLVKPEVTAPGVAVRSSLPGGAYGQENGTSMATPHVAGLAALMLQASPSLTLTQLEGIIEQTAHRLGSPIPNNSYGWGRIDAYAAVAAVAHAGTVAGSVVRASDGTPIAGAWVTATPATSGTAASVITDQGGGYTLALAPGSYTLTASAFGYAPQSQPVAVAENATLARQLALPALPTGILTGRITSRGQPVHPGGYTTYLPLVAGASRIAQPVKPAALPAVTSRPGVPRPVTIAVNGTPVVVTPDFDGYYTAHLPTGSYTVTVTSPGYRVAEAAGVLVNAGETSVHDFDLVPAPTILLVDSGAWYYASQIGYYRQALDELHYTYDVWTVNDATTQVPVPSTLLPYDIVFWSAPQDSPGYLRANQVITTYLDSGGGLFLSGQDVAYYDDGFPLIDSPYFREYLKAAYVADNSGVTQLSGVGGGLLDGLTFGIEGPGGANNQTSPDVIQVLDPIAAASLVSYQGDGSGGQQASLCLPYRAVFLSFGLEAITSSVVRTEIISRSIAWLSGPPATAGLQITSLDEWPVGNFGERVTHTLHLRNAAPTAPVDAFTLTPSGSHWPTAVDQPVLTLAPCSWATATMTVQVPATATWAASDLVTLTARSVGYPGLSTAITRETHAPAPILLVDDNRWYDVAPSYQHALGSNGIPYDLWTEPWDPSTNSLLAPPDGVLRAYPMLVWFSAYDWYEPLKPGDEDRLAAYLENGGRLYFNGQDYLYSTHGPEQFARTYLGVNAYTEDYSSTVVTGVITNPVGSWLGPEAVTYPYDNFSDALTPTASAQVVFVGQEGQPNSVINRGGNWRTAFFAFDPDGLSAAIDARLMGRIAGWLSWLGASDLQVDRPVARQSDTLTYTVAVRNDGRQPIAAYLTATFNADLAPIPGSITGGAWWDAARSAFAWSGGLTPHQVYTFTYQATIASPLPPGHIVSHTVWMGYADHFIKFDRIANTAVNLPVLSQSVFSTTTQPGYLDRPLTYTLLAWNTGSAGGVVTATNQLPADLALVVESVQASRGVAVASDRVISWSVPLAVGDSALLTYTGIVSHIPADFSMRNRAVLDVGLGHALPIEAVTPMVGIPAYWPIILRQSGR